MAKYRMPGLPDDFDPETGSQKPRRKGSGLSLLSVGLLLVLAFVIAYPIYFWTVRRVVVPTNHVLVLMKKHGSQSLPGSQVIIPRPPMKENNPNFETEYAAWEEKYGDCNGILEQVFTEGTYFGFSPFDYDRELINLAEKGQARAIIPQDKVGIVVRKFGEKLAPSKLNDRGQLEPGQVVADNANQVGPLPIVLPPGQHNDYANPYAYDIIHVNPVHVNPGYRGVVTLMSAPKPTQPNSYLVEDGERGVQRRTMEEDFVYVNPYQHRIIPISVRSERFAMSGPEAITFPSYDSFEIALEALVEWRVDREALPRLFVQYGEGADLIPLLRERVILPYARSFCRMVGSQYHAREFISGESKLAFQRQFEKELRAACEAQGIKVEQALILNIIPPMQIKEPINEREIAKQQIETLKQEILVAKSAAELAKQEEMANQNKALGEMNKRLVVVEQEAEQQRGVALTRANQELGVARLQLEAAQNEAKSIIATGEAEAYKVLMEKTAEAEPLRAQIQAFGNGNAYAQYFFYQKVAPSVKSILTDTSGTFGELFKQFIPAAPLQPGTVENVASPTVSKSE